MARPRSGTIGSLGHLRWHPTAVDDRRAAFVGPIQAQHQDELVSGRREPIGLLVDAGGTPSGCRDQWTRQDLPSAFVEH